MAKKDVKKKDIEADISRRMKQLDTVRYREVARSHGFFFQTLGHVSIYPLC